MNLDWNDIFMIKLILQSYKHTIFQSTAFLLFYALYFNQQPSYCLNQISIIKNIVVNQNIIQKYHHCTMLTNLVQKRLSSYFYRFVKPNISQFKSVEDLQFDLRQRELEAIEQINHKFLNHNKNYTKEKQIAQALALSQERSKQIATTNWKFSAVAPKSLMHFTLEQNLSNAKIEYPFHLQQVEPNLPDFNSIPMHFSYKRGVPVIPEYEIDRKVAYVFNLPQKVDPQQISQKIGVQTIKQVKIQYCSLGLPAYAKVYFNSDQTVTNLVINNKNHIQLQDRICFIKTHFDKEKLQLKNRTLVIKNLQSYEHDTIIQLSKYGRIVHLDYPTFITRNVSLEQVKDKYKKEDTLVKINVHKKDGSINSEYYPTIQEMFEEKTQQNPFDLETNMNEKRERRSAEYRNRMRYAPQVNVYEGKESQISIQNMEYCIVTYSCTQQAQNCYFNLRYTNRIQLFDRKTRQEFQVDPSFKKRILRFIDNQHRKIKQKVAEDKSQRELQIDQSFNQLSLFEKLVQMEEFQKQLKQTNDIEFGDVSVLLSYFNTRFNEIKRDLRKQLKSNSFSELAQKQLFGRVLPKHDSKKSKLQLDILAQEDKDFSDIFNNPTRIKNLTSQKIAYRENTYKRAKHREMKRKREGFDETAAMERQADQAEQGEIPEDIPDVDDEFTGQRGFSTIKKKALSFRQRTPLEKANFILKYCEYIKGVISQYQGIFEQNRLKFNTNKPSFLNPDGLTFADGTEYITEEDLCKFLECTRNPDEGQKLFSQFWKDLEYFKSKNINIYEYRDMMENRQYEALLKYSDIGAVKQVYQLEEGQNPQQKVKYLNATVASFGESFRIHEQDGKKVIVKVAKVQNIFPLDKMTRIESQRAKFDAQNKVTESQMKLFEKYKYQILETGQIPSEVRKQFNISEDKSLDDMFEQLASEAGITKKDVQMLVNLQNFTDQQIGESVALQVELQKVRLTQKQSKASDFAKDPSNIQVRDREGFFRVSKFRQI